LAARAVATRTPGHATPQRRRRIRPPGRSGTAARRVRPSGGPALPGGALAGRSTRARDPVLEFVTREVPGPSPALTTRSSSSAASRWDIVGEPGARSSSGLTRLFLELREGCRSVDILLVDDVSVTASCSGDPPPPRVGEPPTRAECDRRPARAAFAARHLPPGTPGHALDRGQFLRQTAAGVVRPPRLAREVVPAEARTDTPRPGGAGSPTA
jgi:hypothetical protein